MTTTETQETIPIPEKYKRPNISLAAKLAGKHRSVLYKDYIDKGVITKKDDDEGNPYIEIGELQRVFGVEKVIKAIHTLENTKDSTDNKNTKKDNEVRHAQTPQKDIETQETRHENPTISVSFEEFLNLKVELAETKIKLEQVEERLELESERAKTFQEQYFQEAQLSRRLIEDKSALNQKTKSWWQKLFQTS